MEQVTNKIEAESKRELKPPYLPVVKLEELIRLISSRNFSDVSSSLFVKYGFRTIDALLAINALEFLGLIDKKGKPTNQMAQLRLQGEARKKAFETMVRKAYEKLFNAMDKPYALSRNELFNEFAVQYELSRRIITSAIPIFLRLCEHAGLKEETSTRKTDSGGKAKKVKKRRNSTKTIKESGGVGFFPVQIVEGKMILNISPELQKEILESNEEEFHQKWLKLKTDLKEFAEIYPKKNVPKKETSTENTEGV